MKWFPTLAKRTNSRQERTEPGWRPGLTPRDVFLAEGFRPVDAEAVLVVINDAQESMETELRDGDRLEFMVSIQGG